MGTLSYMPPEAIAGSNTSVHDGKEIYKVNFVNIFMFVELVIGKNKDFNIYYQGRSIFNSIIYKGKNDCR